MEYLLLLFKDLLLEFVELCNEKKIVLYFYFGDINYEMRILRKKFLNKNYYKLSVVVVCR